MDNIIEIIVFLFIIYSIFGSIFGKKKKAPAESPNRENLPVNRRSSTKSSKGELDTLEELFGFKIPDKTPEYSRKQNPTEFRSSETTSWDPEVEFKRKLRERELLENRDVEKLKSIPNVSLDSIANIEGGTKRRSASVLTSYKDKVEDKNVRTSGIIKQIKEPYALRDFIIVTEILNKPKALR